MAITLRQSDPDFETRFAAFLATKRESSPDVDATVRDIIARVRAEGDAALIDYTKRFDRADLAALGIAGDRPFAPGAEERRLFEQAALIALPLSTGFGVWWVLAAWVRRRAKEAKRPSHEPRETPS